MKKISLSDSISFSVIGRVFKSSQISFLSKKTKGNVVRNKKWKLFCCRWSLIAGRLPGRTDNEIKNYWNSHLRKRAKGEKGSREYSGKQLLNKEKKITSPPPSPPAGVVQTKPVRCNKVVIIPQALDKEHVTQKKDAESQRNLSCSPLQQQEDNSLDLLLDNFDIDNFLLLEAPNSELDQAQLNINGFHENALGAGYYYSLNNFSSTSEFSVFSI